MKTHKQEPIVATRALVVIGCECGWVYSERKGSDAAAARKAARVAYAAHKETATR
jgi:hypothetical protein